MRAYKGGRASAGWQFSHCVRRTIMGKASFSIDYLVQSQQGQRSLHCTEGLLSLPARPHVPCQAPPTPPTSLYKVTRLSRPKKESTPGSTPRSRELAPESRRQEPSCQISQPPESRHEASEGRVHANREQAAGVRYPEPVCERMRQVSQNREQASFCGSRQRSPDNSNVEPGTSEQGREFKGSEPACVSRQLEPSFTSREPPFGSTFQSPSGTPDPFDEEEERSWSADETSCPSLSDEGEALRLADCESPRLLEEAGSPKGDSQRRARTAFSSQQLSRLEQTFAKQQYLPAQERRKLATALQISEIQIKTWFQNRRTKMKRQTLDQQHIVMPFGNPHVPSGFPYGPKQLELPPYYLNCGSQYNTSTPLNGSYPFYGPDVSYYQQTPYQQAPFHHQPYQQLSYHQPNYQQLPFYQHTFHRQPFHPDTMSWEAQEQSPHPLYPMTGTLKC
ncbi:homeobox protein unplugged-like [Ambystoma mexicanum]|uniref:homeobox protein unplugged-like n=1 Tax=Ambystoma mexicanum TaxID=8296 RepID=UPI0037E76034